MRRLFLFPVATAATILIFAAQAGCTAKPPVNLQPTQQIIMTEVAKRMEELDQELAHIDPTLTAIAGMYYRNSVLDATSSLTPTATDAILTLIPPPGTINPALPDQTQEAQLTPSPLATTTPTSTATPSPTPTPTATIDPEKIIDQDDFSQAGRWFTMTGKQFVVEYGSGGYRIYSTAATPVWSVIHSGLKDVIVVTDITTFSGEQDAFFGLVCRQKNDRYYLFAVSPNGTAEIGKIVGANFNSLAATSFQPESYNPGVNQLRAECIGSQLAFYLNGNLLLQAGDSDFTSGAVGVLAGNRSTPGIDVTFDNFLVLEP